jgi:hypothetical protein
MRSIVSFLREKERETCQGHDFTDSGKIQSSVPKSAIGHLEAFAVLRKKTFDRREVMSFFTAQILLKYTARKGEDYG